MTSVVPRVLRTALIIAAIAIPASAHAADKWITKPVTIDGAYAALQLGSATLVAGTSRPVTFGGKPSITIEPGKDALSDGVALPFVKDAKALTGRKLAVSFHVAGEWPPARSQQVLAAVADWLDHQASDRLS